MTETLESRLEVVTRTRICAINILSRDPRIKNMVLMGYPPGMWAKVGIRALDPANLLGTSQVPRWLRLNPSFADGGCSYTSQAVPIMRGRRCAFGHSVRLPIISMDIGAYHTLNCHKSPGSRRLCAISLGVTSAGRKRQFACDQRWMITRSKGQVAQDCSARR